MAEKELVIGGWGGLRKGDWRNGLVAILVRKRSLADNGWLARRLAMRARTAVSRIMGQARERLGNDRKAKALVQRHEHKSGEA